MVTVMKKVVYTIVICMIMICNLTGCTTDKINSSSNKTTIYFVRHGQTDTNVEGLMVGQSGDPQLTEDGKNKAFKLGKGLSKIKFDAAYSSDLTRAYDTAELVLKGANESLKVEKESNFNDISWGDAEGMSWEEISKKYNVADMSQCFGNIDDKKFKSPTNAESKYEFCKRFDNGIKKVLDENPPGANILIVAHSSLAFYLQKIFPESDISGIDNTSVTIVKYDYDNKEFELKDLNDTGYLGQN